MDKLDKMGRVLKTQTEKWTTNNRAELKKKKTRYSKIWIA